MKRLAVIDLGTNTFHLLIVADKGAGEFVEIYRLREYIKLGEEGLDKIGIAAFKRGIEALEKFRGIMDLFEVVKYKACGTAALRHAANADVFIRTAQQRAAIEVEVISGEKEAKLIFNGTRRSGAVEEGNALVMDIGGGSVEFIIGNNSKIHFWSSLSIGVAVLFKKFHRADPISDQMIRDLKDFLHDEMFRVERAIDDFRPFHFIGSSGTFDILGDHLGQRVKENYYRSVPVAAARHMIEEIIPMDVDQRLALAYIPDSRADLIVVALLLIDQVLNYKDFEEIRVSPFAMKEGMVAMLMSEYYTELAAFKN